MRDILEAALALQTKTREVAKEDSQKVQLTESESGLLKSILKSNYWARLPVDHRDRHSVREALVEFTSLCVGDCDVLARKAGKLLDNDSFTVQVLTEGMAQTTTDDHEDAEDGGMYGVGDGGSKDEPTGDADTGTDQGSERGDKAVSGDKGYLDEFDDTGAVAHGDPMKAGVKTEDDEDDYDEMPMDDMEEGEVPQDAPDGADDSERAAKGAALKDGKKQLEAETTGDGKNHVPTASDPGEPNHLKNAEADDAEKRGDVPSHPDYSCNSVKTEDPSNSDFNKGPASVTCESFDKIESMILSLLSESDQEPGSPGWNKLYARGFARAINERAKTVGRRLKSIQEAMPPEIKAKIAAKTEGGQYDSSHDMPKDRKGKSGTKFVGGKAVTDDEYKKLKKSGHFNEVFETPAGDLDTGDEIHVNGKKKTVKSTKTSGGKINITFTDGTNASYAIGDGVV